MRSVITFHLSRLPFYFLFWARLINDVHGGTCLQHSVAMSSDEDIGSLELSYSSSDFEDNIQESHGVQPFMYEPEASDSDSSSDSSESEESSSRLNNTDWLVILYIKITALFYY